MLVLADAAGQADALSAVEAHDGSRGDQVEEGAVPRLALVDFVALTFLVILATTRCLLAPRQRPSQSV